MRLQPKPQLQGMWGQKQTPLRQTTLLLQEVAFVLRHANPTQPERTAAVPKEEPRKRVNR